MSTILIARREHLQAFKEREEFGDAQIFGDDEALRALEVITRTRPAVVVLDRVFAATTRGAALINRIKADSKLSSCAIQVIAHDGGYSRPPAAAAEASVAGAAIAVAAPAEAPGAPLDQRGTRRAPRFKIVDGVEVSVDGNVAMLVDLSIIGAQVVSATVLKPNQRVRVALIDAKRPVRFSGGVVWAAFELAPSGPRYRAGIEFADADPEAVTSLLDAKKQ